MNQTAYCSEHGLQEIRSWHPGKPLNKTDGPLNVSGKLVCGDSFHIVMSQKNYDDLP